MSVAGDNVMQRVTMIFRAGQEGWSMLLMCRGRRSRGVDEWHVLVSITGIKQHKDHHSQTQALWESTIPSVPALRPRADRVSVSYFGLKRRWYPYLQ